VTESTIEALMRQQHEDRRLILETRETVAGMGSKLDAVLASMAQLAHTVNRPAAPTNWIGIAALIVSVLVCAGTYMQSRLSPIERTLHMHDEQVRAQLYQNGKTDAEIAMLKGAKKP
jgi:hypothetical protein